MSSELAMRNSQRAVRLDLRLFRRIARRLLEGELGLVKYELGIQFVSERRMASLNRQFLQHQGATDVITFDHLGAPAGSAAPDLHGELFICPAVAMAQARQFRASFKEELVRYIVHGVLHLRGFDDQTVGARKRMKREEDRLLRRLQRHFKPGRSHITPR